MTEKELPTQPNPHKDEVTIAEEDVEDEEKDGPQKDESGICAYCGFGPHKAKACSYLAEVPPTHWTSSPHIWNYSIALREGESMAITAAAHPSDRLNSWLLETGSDKTPTHSFEDFYTYQEDSPDVAYAYRDYSGNRVMTQGHGEVLVKAGLEDGTTYTFLTTGYYSPNLKQKKTKTYNSEDSLVVTHPTTNSPACGLSTAERTGSPIFHTLWSYVLGVALEGNI
ncbi:uncharacterized protein N7518_003563 [Penicillium psychrosexuale]|uniref:uncharacterized protein n=1 Tax=Penicillium psychrosexuale TaxID=1002107 RepID=UPI0025454C2A|nr:uncharacterized protein N7518_003563 [Penicillium psychrosexuale]KAJ5801495.1 hypothetical protein N7518_003563 [Penicillium psychrosexuale]